jgi:hypothetical protein
MVRLRVLPLVPGAALLAGLGACAPTSSVTGAPPSGVTSPPTAVRPTGTSPGTAVPLADTDIDRSRLCLLLPAGFSTSAEHLAGPARPGPDVAAELEDGVARGRPLVLGAPAGAVRDAGQSVLDRAGALASAVRSGAADETPFLTSLSALDTACESL